MGENSDAWHLSILSHNQKIFDAGVNCFSHAFFVHCVFQQCALLHSKQIRPINASLVKHLELKCKVRVRFKTGGNCHFAIYRALFSKNSYFIAKPVHDCLLPVITISCA